MSFGYNDMFIWISILARRIDTDQVPWHSDQTFAYESTLDDGGFERDKVASVEKGVWEEGMSDHFL
jgi:hypothetical protein